MHHRQRVWDLASGAPSTNRVEIERGDGRRETHALVSGLALGKGDVVRIVTAQGGGWGEVSRQGDGEPLTQVVLVPTILADAELALNA